MSCSCAARVAKEDTADRPHREPQPPPTAASQAQAHAVYVQHGQLGQHQQAQHQQGQPAQPRPGNRLHKSRLGSVWRTVAGEQLDQSRRAVADPEAPQGTWLRQASQGRGVRLGPWLGSAASGLLRVRVPAERWRSRPRQD